MLGIGPMGLGGKTTCSPETLSTPTAHTAAFGRRERAVLAGRRGL